MPAERFHSGTPTSMTCDASKNNNEGCGVKSSDSASFGQALNDRGGGWFAMRRTRNDGIAVWFWGRNDPSVPPEISGSASNLSLSTMSGRPGLGLILEAIQHDRDVVQPNARWGVPAAHFPPQGCQMDKFFDEHVLVFDLTFCGDWAGVPALWAAAGCGSATAGACEACKFSHAVQGTFY
jgi:hypothetical protein